MSTVYDVAVVGAAGFLGGAITRSLEASGHSVLPVTLENPLISDGSWAPSAEGVRTVVWAAGVLSPMLAEKDPALVEFQLGRFREAVQLAATREVVPRMVLLSSGGTVYGRPGLPAYREDHEPHPANAYGRFKLAEERILADSHETATAVRVANAYGPGQLGLPGQGVLAAWMRAVRDGEPVTIVGAGEVARDYVYVDDVADAVRRVVERPDAPPVVNLGSGTPVPLNELLDIFEYVVGPERVRVERFPDRGVDAPSTWLDVTLAYESLGWRATTPLAEGIARMWDWFPSA